MAEETCGVRGAIRCARTFGTRLKHGNPGYHRAEIFVDKHDGPIVTEGNHRGNNLKINKMQPQALGDLFDVEGLGGIVKRPEVRVIRLNQERGCRR